MSGDLVPTTPDVDSWVDVLEPAYRLAKGLSQTEFVPKGLQGKPDAIMAAILAGRERGLGPLVSLAGINVISGRPSLSAELLAALVVRAGHTIDYLQSTDTAAEVRITRGDNQSTAVVRWTKADAEVAGLWGKQGPWRQFPRAMLWARAVSECARRVCPDVAWGLDTDAVVADTAPTTRPATTIQLTPAPDTRQEPAETVEEPEAVEQPTPTTEPATEPLITPGQMRKLGALIGVVEKTTGDKLDRDSRRDMIRELAGLDHLDSAKDLTISQASEAIDTLTAITSNEEAADGSALGTPRP